MDERPDSCRFPTRLGSSRSGTKWEQWVGWTIGAVAMAWIACQTLAAIWGRSMYGDGGWYVLFHLLNPQQFNDYDYRRSFASYITQTPLLIGQRLGVETVIGYAGLYSLGTFLVPVLIFVFALYLARTSSALLVATLAALVVFGFGINFINSEANLFFALVWLTVVILALPGERPRLRGMMLPLLALVLLRVYEGMLLVGPLLAAWAALILTRSTEPTEKSGLLIAALLFVIGTAIGFSGFITPRDPANATKFLASTFDYLRNPQLFLLLSTLVLACTAVLDNRPLRWVLLLGGCALAILFVRSVVGLKGYYAYTAYYYNRTFLVLLLPIAVGGLLSLYRWSPGKLADKARNCRFLWMLIPFGAALGGDILGSIRWHQYVDSFCRVLDDPSAFTSPVNELKRRDARTGWVWTHPTLSVLLRARGSKAMVLNEQPANWQPFDPAKDIALSYAGVCESSERKQSALNGPVTFSFRDLPPRLPILAITGLSQPEAWATWSDGPHVEIRLAQDLPPSFDLTLMIAAAFGSNQNVEIAVSVDSRRRSFTVDTQPKQGTLSFTGTEGARTIRIDIPHPQSPKQLGLADDERQLGLAFVSGTITPK